MPKEGIFHYNDKKCLSHSVSPSPPLCSGFSWKWLLSAHFTRLYACPPVFLAKAFRQKQTKLPSQRLLPSPAAFHGPPTPWDHRTLQHSCLRSHSWTIHGDIRRWPPLSLMAGTKRAEIGLMKALLLLLSLGESSSIVRSNKSTSRFPSTLVKCRCRTWWWIRGGHPVCTFYCPVLPSLQKLCFPLQQGSFFSHPKRSKYGDAGIKNKMLSWSQVAPIFQLFL